MLCGSDCTEDEEEGMNTSLCKFRLMDEQWRDMLLNPVCFCGSSLCEE